MSISIIPYLDESAAALVAAKLSSGTAVQESDASSGFAAVLNENTAALAAGQTDTVSEAAVSGSTAAELITSDELEAIFEEAANTYGVSKNLLKSIAKAESNFNPSAVSSAGAIGVMQLMPGTAASLGVSNPYDARENIMGGACLISSLLTKYNGDTSLALAAYNAGSGNVDKYGGIPPFTETQNYVQKVLASLGETIQIPTVAAASPSSVFDLTGTAREEANQMLENFFTSHNITKESLDLIVALMKLNQMGQTAED